MCLLIIIRTWVGEVKRLENPEVFKLKDNVMLCYVNEQGD